MSYGSHYDADANLYQVPFMGNHFIENRETLVVRVPGSKSITNRALLLATLAEGTSTLRGALFSDDSRHFLKCVQDLGFEAVADETTQTIRVTGCGGAVPRQEASLYVGSAGTAARFLTAYLGVSQGVYHMDASRQMRRRPMAPLLDSLKELGCEILYKEEEEKTAQEERHSHEGYFPFIIKSHGFGRDAITVDIEHSSQFLSALLIASRLASKDFTVRIQGSHGMAYIEMTRRMMEQFGVCAEQTDERTFRTAAGQRYLALDYQIEPDVSAACYFYALAPLLGVPVLVEHVRFDSLQGDVAFLKILERMGCALEEREQGVAVLPPADHRFHGVTADLSACSDQAITLAAIAPFADSPTTITGIGHIRFQESDRIHAIVTELGRMGVRCEEDASLGSITVYPGFPKPCVVDTYDDHRIAMGFALTGLRVPGVAIRDPGCCRKTFENYFEVLEDALGRLGS
ncbi:MAG: 3-phosphoshikimate 1-carboxyvinyltransferase [Muribaculum sp.]|nr:3-phosphoshikimate 1-carboxyvinyltransferase [Muribaculum sp.]